MYIYIYIYLDVLSVHKVDEMHAFGIRRQPFFAFLLRSFCEERAEEGWVDGPANENIGLI